MDSTIISVCYGVPKILQDSPTVHVLRKALAISNKHTKLPSKLSCNSKIKISGCPFWGPQDGMGEVANSNFLRQGVTATIQNAPFWEFLGNDCPPVVCCDTLRGARAVRVLPLGSQF